MSHTHTICSYCPSAAVCRLSGYKQKSFLRKSKDIFRKSNRKVCSYHLQREIFSMLEEYEGIKVMSIHIPQ